MLYLLLTPVVYGILRLMWRVNEGATRRNTAQSAQIDKNMEWLRR